jgi:hypothetical protein
MTYCLPKAAANAFLKALRAGDIDPARLMDMASDERHAFFEGIVGKDNAKPVNALFEKKLLLRDQMAGLVDWAHSVAGLDHKVVKGMVEKIQAMTTPLQPNERHGFLGALAEQRFGASITEDEARQITDGSQEIARLKESWNADSGKWASEDARLRYGSAYTEFQHYVGGLKRDAKAQTFMEFAKSPGNWVSKVGGTTKAIVASLDNSFFLRQGLKMMLTNPDIWGSAFLKSWGDMGKELGKVDAMPAIKADIFSRPNAMNGKYAAGKYALGIDSEEAFPSHLPEKIPLLGRLYKASESAFNGAALRMRADYADRIIAKAEENGVDTLDNGQAESIGSLVNAMTGRGNLTLSGKTADAINTAFFSVRFFKSNYDTLTMHSGGYGFEEGPARDFARKEAAMNLLKIVGGIGAILATASALFPGSVETDPRSSDFGKIKIGATKFDVTGGMGSLVTLAARIVPTMHNGHWGEWSKSATSGKYTDLRAGKFGRQTTVDVVNNFWEGKLSPLAGALRDTLKGRNFDGSPVTVGSVAGNLLTPMPIQTFMDAYSNPKAAPTLAVLIADALGVSANTPAPRKHAN